MASRLEKKKQKSISKKMPAPTKIFHVPFRYNLRFNYIHIDVLSSTAKRLLI